VARDRGAEAAAAAAREGFEKKQMKMQRDLEQQKRVKLHVA